jgi:hypothetical protein
VNSGTKLHRFFIFSAADPVIKIPLPENELNQIADRDSDLFHCYCPSFSTQYTQFFSIWKVRELETKGKRSVPKTVHCVLFKLFPLLPLPVGNRIYAT